MHTDTNDRTGPVPTERLWREVDGRKALTDAGALLCCGLHSHQVNGSGAVQAKEIASAFFDAVLSAAKARGFDREGELVHELQVAQTLSSDITWPLLDLAEEVMAHAGPDGRHAAAQWLAAAFGAARGQQGRGLQ